MRRLVNRQRKTTGRRLIPVGFNPGTQLAIGPRKFIAEASADESVGRMYQLAILIEGVDLSALFVQHEERLAVVVVCLENPRDH